MKKFLLSIGAATLAVSAMANPAKIAPGLGSMTDIIYSAEGQRQKVSVTTSGLTMSGFSGLEVFQDQVMASHVIYGDDNEVYIYNIFPYLLTKTYIKGVRNGDEIIVDLPQAVFYDDSEGYVEAYYYTLVDIVEGVDDEGYINTSFNPQEKASVTFSVDEFGTMVAQGLDEKLLFGACDSEDGMWIGLGASKIEISSFDETPVEAPANLEVLKNYWTSEGTEYGWQVNFAQDGDDVYFQGLSERMPNAWVKANVVKDGNTAIVSIPQDQYVGDYGSYHIFTKCAEMTTDNKGNIFFEDEPLPSDYEFQLIWDLDKNTMEAKDKNIVLLFNISKREVRMINDLMDMKLIRQESYDGVPQNPFGLEFEDVMEDEGFSLFSFNLPAISTEGKYLLLDDLKYVIYINDDEWTFDADEYFLEDSMEEVPWSFSNYWFIKDFDSCRHRVAFFVEGIDTFGVQSVYNYNGVETRSEIMTLDVEEFMGVDDVDAAKVASVKYYDLTGREVANPAAGIFIKRTAFHDGSVSSLKTIIR
ncbi:MAG: hypothetical protein K2L17_09775 [Muribaculaceae bacterium]|nr:hypothetical protein [Muribaculaceae bacterium]